MTFSTCTLVRKGTQVDEMMALSGMVTSLQVAGIDEPTSLRYICGKHLQPRNGMNDPSAGNPFKVKNIPARSKRQFGT